ncbi:MAG: ubiquinone/menaquinone biosynthesis C-methylase UbiE [Hyphomicrobiaceae bacterium]|jgi:ubiquinone/menaquinone biosynthesis C-methylase UbiE
MEEHPFRGTYRVWQRESFFRSALNSRVFEAVMRALATPIYVWAEDCIREDLRTARRVIDIGCGNAIFARRLSESLEGREFTLIDQSASQIEMGAANIEAVRRRNSCEASVGSANALPYPDNSFDFVLSTGSINLWRSPVGGLEECLRVAKPGGVIWIFDQAPVKGFVDALDSLFRLRVFGLGIPGYTLERAREMGDSVFPEPASIEENGSLYGFRWTKPSAADSKTGDECVPHSV